MSDRAADLLGFTIGASLAAAILYTAVTRFLPINETPNRRTRNGQPA